MYNNTKAFLSLVISNYVKLLSNACLLLSNRMQQKFYFSAVCFCQNKRNHYFLDLPLTLTANAPNAKLSGLSTFLQFQGLESNEINKIIFKQLKEGRFSLLFFANIYLGKK